MISQTDRAFGWDYPMGAQNDPSAPWNQPDNDTCDKCKKSVPVSELNKLNICPDCQRKLDEEGPQEP